MLTKSKLHTLIDNAFKSLFAWLDRLREKWGLPEPGTPYEPRESQDAD